MRPALCQDALRSDGSWPGLAPLEPEVHGLGALMELQASRAAARVGPAGSRSCCSIKDRGRWDHLLIRRGLAAWSAPRRPAVGTARTRSSRIAAAMPAPAAGRDGLDPHRGAV